MRVLIVANDPSLFSAESAVRARMREYASHMEELHVLSQSPSNAEDVVEGGLYLHALPGGRILSLMQMEAAASGLVTRYGIEVISAQDPFEHGFIASRVAKAFSLPLHIQIHTDFLSPWFARSGVFRSMRVHMPALNKVRQRIADKVLPQAKGIRVVSKRIADSLVERYGNTLAPVEILPIAVHVDDVPKAPLPAPAFAFSLITVSRLEPEKRIEDIIMAVGRIARLFPSVGLYVVGAGRERYRLELLAKRLGLFSRVIFLGERADARGLMKSASAYIQASAYEGYGLTLLEAALARIPIITTDVGIVGEVFKGYEDVLSAPPGDPAALALHINGLVGDHQARLKLVMSAEHTARNYLATLGDQPLRIVENMKKVLAV